MQHHHATGKQSSLNKASTREPVRMKNNMFHSAIHLLLIVEKVNSWISSPLFMERFRASSVDHDNIPTSIVMMVTRLSMPEADCCYKETPPDECLRLFWERQTFSDAEQLVDAVIYRNQSTNAPLLINPEPPWNDNVSETAMNLFSPLFNKMCEVTSNDTISLTQSSHKNNFRLDVAYRGSSFCGFQTQPHNDMLPSVQQSLEEWLAMLSNDDKVDVRSSGRTDAGVHALGQVCRFRTRSQQSAKQVLEYMETCPLVANGSMKCIKVTRVSDSFHPTFGCTKRAYLYMLDPMHLTERHVKHLNTILQRLEGHQLDYVSMSYGRVKTETTLCTLDLCRAVFMTVSTTDRRVLCIMLVGDRFLRRMVRILVATALREVLTHTKEEMNEKVLLDILVSGDSSQSARPAPPNGLMFVGAEVS